MKQVPHHHYLNVGLVLLVEVPHGVSAAPDAAARVKVAPEHLVNVAFGARSQEDKCKHGRSNSTFLHHDGGLFSNHNNRTVSPRVIAPAFFMLIPDHTFTLIAASH